MNSATFFAALRRRESGVFGTSLSQPQVDGINAILDACSRHKVTDAHHLAHILAHVYRETGGYMSAIKETVYASHKDKNPSDAAVITRLNNAWAKGQLGNVRTPYWRDGWFGRGKIQITHRDNYAKFERLLGVPLTKNPSLALDQRISADIAVLGMRDGHFRSDGRGPLSLARYVFPRDLDNPPDTNPRRIVNGKDGSDREVANAHRAFHKALIEASYSAKAAPPAPAKPAPAPTTKPAPAAPQPAKRTLLQIILDLFFGRK